jgi:L-seryl-tRNA(Ser) seleniumtransferase
VPAQSSRHHRPGVAETVSLLPLLPSVEKLISGDSAVALAGEYSRAALTVAIREELESMRAEIRAGRGGVDAGVTAPAAILERVRVRLEAEQTSRVRPVINATGVVLHTNLGRALISPAAAAKAAAAATAPCALEYDLETGRRGQRDAIVERHLVALTGAEAATVVNNNAAAVLLLLNTLADGREVVVSRGELVEIGGSFRIPEVMKKGGAILREVGTTNRTHLDDYARAIGENTALLLKVHTSNYRVVGFTSAVELPELRRLANLNPGIWVAEDLGSGALVDLAPHGLGYEPLVRERLAEGADIVTFSGDKLLGGPQCGILAGRREVVERLRKNPLTRALRCDKMTLAALEETLRAYRFDPFPVATTPVLAMLTRPLAELDVLATLALEGLREALDGSYSIEIATVGTQVGAGARPDTEIESRALAIRSSVLSASEIATLFRRSDPPIIGRVEKERFLLDLRTVVQASDVIPQRHRP